MHIFGARGFSIIPLMLYRDHLSRGVSLACTVLADQENQWTLWRKMASDPWLWNSNTTLAECQMFILESVGLEWSQRFYISIKLSSVTNNVCSWATLCNAMKLSADWPLTVQGQLTPCLYVLVCIWNAVLNIFPTPWNAVNDLTFAYLFLDVVLIVLTVKVTAS